MHWEVEASYFFGWEDKEAEPTNFNVDEMVELFQDWTRRQRNHKYREAMNDPIVEKSKYLIYLDMKRNHQLPCPDKPEVRASWIPLEDQLRDMLGNPVDLS